MLVHLWITLRFPPKIRLPSTTNTIPVPETRQLPGFQAHTTQYHDSLSWRWTATVFQQICYYRRPTRRATQNVRRQRVYVGPGVPH